MQTISKRTQNQLAALIGGIQRIEYPTQPHPCILVVATDAGKTWYTFTDVAEVWALVAGKVDMRDCRIPF